MTTKQLSMAAAGLCLLCVLPASGADFSSWSKKMPIRFAGYTQTGTLTNFPVLVQFAQGSNNFSYADVSFTNGADLRFTDATETNELTYEIESWNTNGVSYIWVQVPALSNANAAIRAFYGQVSPPATTATNWGAVWDSNHKGVWHLATTNNTVLSGRDSTANAIDGVVTAATATNGLADGAGYFNTNGVNLGTNAAIRTLQLPMTISAWFRASDKGAQRPIFGQYKTTTGSQLIKMIRLDSGTLKYYASTTSGAFQYGGTQIPTTNDWHFVAVVVSNTIAAPKFQIYLDNASEFPTMTSAAALSSSPDGTVSNRIGRNDAATPEYFLGSIDEVRISDVARASNWIWANWMNQASNRVFNEYGDAGSQNTTEPSIYNILGATNVLAMTAYLNGSLIGTGSAPAHVWAYWDTNNWGNNKTWAGAADLGERTVGSISYRAENLTSNTWYWYTYYASNSAGFDAWSSIAPKKFETLGLPGVNNVAATNVGSSSATLGGTLTTGATAHAYIFAGADTNAWTWTNDCSTVVEGTSFSINLTNLPNTTKCYYRAYASNACGEAWAPVTNFITQPPTGTIYWDGGAGTTNWGDTANWNPDTAVSVNTTAWANDVVLDDTYATCPSGIAVGGGQYCRGVRVRAPRDITLTSGAFYYQPPTQPPYVLDVEHSDGLAHTDTWRGIIMFSPNGNYRVAGTGTVVNMAGNITCSSTIPTVNKDGSGLLSCSILALNNNTTRLSINGGVFEIAGQYGIFDSVAALKTIGISNNATFWAPSASTLMDQVTYAGDKSFPAVAFEGAGTLMLNSQLDGGGTARIVHHRGGTWMPGTTNTAGRLTVCGNINFLRTTNGLTNCTLRIDITGSGATAGVDYDQLFITNGAVTATSLTNVDLIVTVASSLSTADKTYTIIDDAGTAFTNTSPFHSVSWLGPSGLDGKVAYETGAVKLYRVGLPRGSLLLLR